MAVEKTLQPGPGAAAGVPDPSRRTRAAWVVTWLMCTVITGATVPTPIYPLYAHRLGLTPLLVTAVFATYALGTLCTLLLFGGMSDRIGRRPILLAALCLGLLSCALFAASPTLPGILGGRLLCGFAVGLSSGTATAYLGELLADRRKAALVASATNMAGLGIGPMLSGILIQYGPGPMLLPYLVLAALLLPGFAVLALPETVVRAAGPVSLRPQRLRIPAEHRSAFASSALAALGSFAALGLLAALAGTFLRDGLHITNHLMVGVAPCTAFTAAALAQVWGSRVAPRTGVIVGMAVLPAGLALIVAAIPAVSLSLFLGGAVVFGSASGLAFRSGLALLSANARPDQAGQLVSGYFTSAYVGLSLPVVGTGLLLGATTLLNTAAVFTAAVTAVALLCIVPIARARS
ncbi:MFS transporter [Kitasatospora sp. NPDC005856]|uniref:MFS transporter n=1 Tax=Kitasatospora sp. NPDC005856 TaxID=3154566 RepID=UPI0033FC56FE